jgi:two-component system sensor histidine kinase AtoS
MEPKASNEQQHQDELERLIEGLPEEAQALCASGKSVVDLAHLVKNILQMVSGSSEIMQLALERKQYDRIAKSWTIFEPNFVRLKKFILDLIKFTKHYPIHEEPCDINEAVRKAVRSCEYVLKGHNVKVLLEPGNGIPSSLLDGERVEEIAANLITHALDNLPEHEGTITVRTEYLGESRELQITVCDDGPALEKSVILLLKQPFERTRNMCGTGFDIPLAALFAQQHGGYLEIDSTPPKGNVVRVFLPVIK